MDEPRTPEGSARRRLAELGLALPALVQEHPVEPNRCLAVEHGGVLHISGTGTAAHRGRLGDDLDAAAGYEAARATALVMLARIEEAIGSLDRIDRWLAVRGFVACAPGFTAQSRVLDGFSDLVVSVYGERAVCARSAIGVAALPLGIAVEVEATVALGPDRAAPGRAA